MLAPLIISLAALALSAWSLWRSRGLERFDTHEHLKSLAKMAVAHAEQMGGTGAQKLAHAVSAFQRLDEGDNGRRDFTDAEGRIAIEACLSKEP